MRSFWAGETLANTVALSASLASSASYSASISLPRTIRSTGNPDLAADLPGDDVIVAGEDLDLHATGLSAAMAGAGGLLGRVEEGDEAKQA